MRLRFGRAAGSKLAGWGREFVVAASIGLVAIVVGVAAALILRDDPTFDDPTADDRSPETSEILDNPVAMAISEPANLVAVIARGPTGLGDRAIEAGTLALIDRPTGTITGFIRVGIDPVALAFDADGTWLAIVGRGPSDQDNQPIGDGWLVLLDARTLEVHTSIPTGKAPVDVVVDQRTGRIAVLDQGRADGQGDVTLVDLDTARIVSTVPVGTYPTDLGLAEDRGQLFVANFVSNTITIIDIGDGREVGSIRLGSEPGTLRSLELSMELGLLVAVSGPVQTNTGSVDLTGAIHIIDLDRGFSIVRSDTSIRDPRMVVIDERSPGLVFGLFDVDHDQAELVMHDLTTGHVVWSRKIAEVPIAMADADGRLTLVERDARLVSLLDSKDGTLLCSHEFESGIASIAAIDASLGGVWSLSTTGAPVLASTRCS
jgi:hypothetical protein